MSGLFESAVFAAIGFFAAFFALFGEDREGSFWGTVVIKAFWGAVAVGCFAIVIYALQYGGGA